MVVCSLGFDLQCGWSGVRGCRLIMWDARHLSLCSGDSWITAERGRR